MLGMVLKCFFFRCHTKFLICSRSRVLVFSLALFFFLRPNSIIQLFFVHSFGEIPLLFRFTHWRFRFDTVFCRHSALCARVCMRACVRAYDCFDKYLLRVQSLFLFCFGVHVLLLREHAYTRAITETDRYTDAHTHSHTHEKFTLQIYCLAYLSLWHMKVFIKTIYSRYNWCQQ